MTRIQVITRVLALACAMAGISSARAESGNPYLFLDGTYVRPQERVPQSDTSLGLRIGGGMPLLRDAAGPMNLELGVFWNPLAQEANSIVDDGRQTGVMLDLTQVFATEGPVNPMLFFGVGGVHETLGPNSGNYFAAEGGLGVVATLADHLRLRLSLSAQDVRNSDIPGRSQYLDYRFNFGLAVPFGNAPAKAQPVRIVDADGDGVPDAQDHCPNAAAATADGCPPPPPPPPPAPKDTDNDGVDDAVDACPGTLEGLKVDTRGCAAETASIVLKGVTFLIGSAELTTDAKAVLDKAAESLAGQPGMNVEIGGHTDSSGDAKKNLALSQARADSVRKYLISKGIEGSRLTAKGYGSTQPIADNKTKTGRAENRRVEMKVVH